MGLDSLELVLGWEEEFGISIPNEAAATFETPRNVGDYIEPALDAQGRSLPRAEIDRILKQVVIEQLGIDESVYGIDVKFVEEMGVD